MVCIDSTMVCLRVQSVQAGRQATEQAQLGLPQLLGLCAGMQLGLLGARLALTRAQL